MKSMIVLCSWHHNNTRKVAEAIADVIRADIKNPAETDEEDFKNYDLIGFGSGIDSGKHYRELLDFADKLPPSKDRRCFIFSTSAIYSEEKTVKDHARLRETLLSKGYRIEGEFSCPGFNTNSFLKYFGGMNKDRPNAGDLQNARKFAGEIRQPAEHAVCL